MPLINGIKMACEPCIRGHRSTKCTHASERLMIPVRKPGRPLSVCPHPPDRPCGCGSVTAAISRRQPCRCGTSAPTPPSSKSNSGSQTTEAPSPTRVLFRVQKSRPASRKQSLDPATLEKAGTKFNFVAHAPSQPKEPTSSIATAASSASSAILPAQNSATKESLPPTDARSTETQVKSCCAGRPAEIANDIDSRAAERLILPKEEPATESGCCGAKSMAPSTPLPIPTAPLTHPDDAITAEPPIYGGDPSIMAFPPSYGSYQHPLDPLGWRQMFEAQTFGPTPQYDETLGLAMPPLEIHSCFCGDGCQCIGCAMHPYNEATQNYVRSAWKFANETISEPFSPPQTILTAAPGAQSNGYGQMTPPTAGTPPNPHSPSENGSAGAGDEVLSASDYFFVSYAFGEDSCGGDDHSCPCGDDCKCLGCTIHRQPT